VQAIAGSAFSSSAIGGTATGEGNTIAFNTAGGILLNNANNNIFIARNLIYSNPAGASSSSINLNGLANGNRVAPSITSASTTNVSGTSVVADDVIQVYKNTSSGANCQDMNEYVGTTTAVGGVWSLSASLNSGDVLIAIGSDNTNTMTSAASTCTIVSGGSNSLTLNLTAAIQGFLNTSVTPNRMNMTDKIKVILRANVAPGYAALDSAIVNLDSVSLSATMTFHPASTVPGYYIVVKHRNSVETWSMPVTFTGSSLSYDFTDAASKAYGNNLIQKGTKFCIYGADVNQDRSVDLKDASPIQNAINNYLWGYSLITDTTGDQFVDLKDSSVEYNNQSNYVQAVCPICN
jgi:hypothetical protein